MSRLRNALRPGDYVLVGVFAAWLAIRISVALATIAPFAGQLADGPFQLFDAVRRIADGQSIGNDFQFFHGAGVAFLHMPLYALLGGGLFASEISRQLLPLLVVVLATYCGLRLLALSRRSALRAGMVVLLLSEMFLTTLVEPGNGLLSVRSGVAMILLLPIAHAVEKAQGSWGPLRGGLAMGALAGVVFAIATDQGLAVVAGTAVTAVILFRHHLRSLLVVVPAFAVSTAVSMLLLLALLSRSVTGALEAARYPLLDVSADQFWYFGSPPNLFARDFGDLVGQPIIIAALICLAVSVGLVVAARHHLPPQYLPRVTLLLAYGAVSTAPFVAMSYLGYIDPALRVALLVVVSVVVLTWPLWRPEHLVARVALVTATAVAAGSFAAVVWDDVDGRGPVQLAQLARFGVDGTQSLVADGPRLDPFWSDYRDATEADADWDPCQTWYLYAGLAQAHAECFGPQTYDYVIHGLGSHRQEYLDDFVAAEAPYVETISPRLFGYEEWVRSTTWPVYQELLDHYEPFRLSPYTIMWRRVPDNGVQELDRGDFVIDGDTLTAQRPAGPREVMSVHVEYDVEGLSTPTTRLFATPTGTGRFSLPVPVNPHRDEVLFPLFPAEGTPSVSVTTDSAGVLNFRDWQANSATWTAYRLPDTPQWQEFLGAS